MSEADREGPAPLILTALLPKDMAAWATALRTEHFPPERNYLNAHVTLFHAIPAQCEGELSDLLKRIVADNPPPHARLEGIMSLGGGTALKLASEAMLHHREDIADHFTGMLTGQDQHKPRLHVTIQNKVTSTKSKELQAEMTMDQTAEPRDFAFRGFALFHYRGGPWEHIRDWVFRGR